jgi:hypothetical protein
MDKEIKIPVLDVDSLSYSLTPKDNPKDRVSVEIGDSKDLTQFQPQVKIMRWDNEVNLSYRLKTDGKENETVTQADEVITWDKGNYQVQTYDLPVSETNPEGAMEFEVILKEKPLTNKIEFTLNTKGLDFFYQPELTEEEIERGYSRPENATGGYAVYCSEQKINWVGGKEYKCGQLGFIYRPKIVDSSGMEVWGELKIDTNTGLLTVTIPQDFLDKAVYPIKSNDRFGYTTNGGSAASIEGKQAGGDFVMGGASGTGSSITFWCNDGGFAGLSVVYLILFSNNASPKLYPTYPEKFTDVAVIPQFVENL